MLDKSWILQVISLYVECHRTVAQVFHWGWRTCLFAGAVAMFTLSEPQSPRFHFSPPEKHENGAEIWKCREGAVQRAGEPTAGHQLLPTAEKASGCGGGSRSLLAHPQLHLARGLRNPVPLPRGSSSFMRPQPVPGCPALRPGSFLAEPGFSPCPTTAPPSCSFPNTASASSWTAASRLPVPQPAAGCGPGEGLLNALEISGRAETSFQQQALPYSAHQHRGQSDLVRGQGEIPRHGRAFPISQWFPPASAKANEQVNAILKCQLWLLARMRKDARKQGFC